MTPDAHLHRHDRHIGRRNLERLFLRLKSPGRDEEELERAGACYIMLISFHRLVIVLITIKPTGTNGFPK